MSKKDKKIKQTDKESLTMRALSAAELKKQLLDFTKDDFKLRMQKGTGQLIKPHLIKQVRRQIARVKTILTKKNSLEAKGS